MVVIITGASHTGKTVLAQRLLEQYLFPYLSVDHLKMGLIRSKQTNLTPEDDKKLEPYLWSIIKEIIKTAIENNQNLIIEGCYIPFDWRKDFSKVYLKSISYICLIMTTEYIQRNIANIKSHADEIEHRIDDYCEIEQLISDNQHNLNMCEKYNLPRILISDEYEVNFDLF
ncbi:MAG: ATP-binding protein [Ruminococcus flavefaciens]|nr:ATP-binding protein [Ruminococcus flavefaciens]MCM1062319.1 ATP-binding protein [Eubacterium sp.]